jgi:hypothetical protein
VSRPIKGEDAFVSGESSFLVGTWPQDALSIPLVEVLDILRRRVGSAVDLALSPEAVDLSLPLSDLPEPVRSPRSSEDDTSWMRTTNMIGINVRTVGDYAGVIKYALTLPRAIDSIHLLPIWEPGVVESLYGIASWNLNTEFFSDEWHQLLPQLDTVEKQLRAVSNLVHVMGKTIGMDVIPHTDRFSEAAVGTPNLFEWMRVVDDRIVDKSESLTEVVEDAVYEWLALKGSGSTDGPIPHDATALFALHEADRLEILFGPVAGLHGRIDRRIDLIMHLKRLGLEPVPATMGVPFRGIEVDPDSVTLDDHGMRWPDFRIIEPESMSRVFSPLARFKLYGRVDDNANWEIDFSKPRDHVWDYVCRHYAGAQHIGNFDFMRGDMSHVQMRPDGVPDVIDDRYDILRTVKTYIQATADIPWFGYFAESFLPPRDIFQFGEELDHLEASLADATLGDLQSTVVGSPVFLQRFRKYLDELTTRTCAPAFCIGTADKDDPRFDEFYRSGNEARLFTALFLADMPSYVGLGYEIRDVHQTPVQNERYTKLFVFKEEGDSNVYPSKARFGDEFIWGDNEGLFQRVTRIREIADRIMPEIERSSTRWLIPPDATGNRDPVAWTHEPGSHVFVVNYDLDSGSGYFGVPGLDQEAELRFVFSTHANEAEHDTVLTSNGFFHRIEDLGPGEGRVYHIGRPDMT